MAVLRGADVFVQGILGCPSGKFVCVCGMAVLREADVFVQGILGCPSGKFFDKLSDS